MKDSNRFLKVCAFLILAMFLHWAYRGFAL